MGTAHNSGNSQSECIRNGKAISSNSVTTGKVQPGNHQKHCIKNALGTAKQHLANHPKFSNNDVTTCDNVLATA